MDDRGHRERGVCVGVRCAKSGDPDGTNSLWTVAWVDSLSPRDQSIGQLH